MNVHYSTIIIPTRDRHDLLVACLDSLIHYSPYSKADTVVVDTGNGDDARWADSQGYKAIAMPDATFAHANNEAVRQYPGEYVVLLNNDCFATFSLDMGWIGGNTLPDRHSLMGAHLVYPDGLTQHAGIGFDSNGGGYNMWRLAPSEHPEVKRRRYVPAVTFACARIPYHIWDELGGLDEGFTNAYEDIDFCLRAREAGYPVLYDPAVSAVHLEGQTAGRHDHDAESWAYYRTKWLDTGRIYGALGVWPFSVERR